MTWFTTFTDYAGASVFYAVPARLDQAGFGALADGISPRFSSTRSMRP